jgi:hypothetical protein
MAAAGEVKGQGGLMRAGFFLQMVVGSVRDYEIIWVLVQYTHYANLMLGSSGLIAGSSGLMPSCR